MTDIGMYFRVKRNKGWVSADITELTKDEISLSVVKGRSAGWIVNVIWELLRVIKKETTNE